MDPVEPRELRIANESRSQRLMNFMKQSIRRFIINVPFLYLCLVDFKFGLMRFYFLANGLWDRFVN